MRLKSFAKALIWFGAAPLTRCKYLFVESLRRAAGGMHFSSKVSGSGEFHFAPTSVIGRRTSTRADLPGSLVVLRGVWIGDDCELSTREEIVIGEHTSLQNRTVILGNVTVGAGCVCAPNLYISSAWHHFEDNAPLPIRWQDANASVNMVGTSVSLPVEVGEDCWIGINVVITPGVCIGRGCVIGANSVVTRDLPPYSVAVGAPAKVVRQRLVFLPPRNLKASLADHLPYFYKGFDMWRSGAKTLDSALDHGGWLAGAQFKLALQIESGQEFTLTLHSYYSGVLVHGSERRPVGRGFIQISFPAQIASDGMLAFTWSREEGLTGSDISVIAADQGSN